MLNILNQPFTITEQRTLCQISYLRARIAEIKAEFIYLNTSLEA